MNLSYTRPFVSLLQQRLSEQQPRIQVLTGPRQVGKTTGVRQMLQHAPLPSHYANADDLLTTDRTWLLEQWQRAMALGSASILVLDEIQKVPNWSETVKALWDKGNHGVRLVVLGSSALQIQQGLTESLAGRFELMRIHHWSYPELRQAFGYDLNRYLTYGGYPGAVTYEHDFERWYSYLKNSIVESVIGKDILLNQRVRNPALFRQAFEIISSYPAQEISYSKLLGQLQDKGNTDLVKYYIELYAGAYLVTTLSKFTTRSHLTRSSSPKVLPACPALYTMHLGPTVLNDSEKKGRIFELAVGNHLTQLPGELYYWREGNNEVDYIYRHHQQLYAIEVKSGRRKSSKGLNHFMQNHAEAHPIIITPENFELFSEQPLNYLQLVA